MGHSDLPAYLHRHFSFLFSFLSTPTHSMISLSAAHLLSLTIYVFMIYLGGALPEAASGYMGKAGVS